jgi:hypothetical protein
MCLISFCFNLVSYLSDTYIGHVFLLVLFGLSQSGKSVNFQDILFAFCLLFMFLTVYFPITLIILFVS